MARGPEPPGPAIALGLRPVVGRALRAPGCRGGSARRPPPDPRGASRGGRAARSRPRCTRRPRTGVERRAGARCSIRRADVAAEVHDPLISTPSCSTAFRNASFAISRTTPGGIGPPPTTCEWPPSTSSPARKLRQSIGEHEIDAARNAFARTLEHLDQTRRWRYASHGAGSPSRRRLPAPADPSPASSRLHDLHAHVGGELGADRHVADLVAPVTSTAAPPAAARGAARVRRPRPGAHGHVRGPTSRPARFATSRSSGAERCLLFGACDLLGLSGSRCRRRATRPRRRDSRRRAATVFSAVARHAGRGAGGRGDPVTGVGEPQVVVLAALGRTRRDAGTGGGTRPFGREQRLGQGHACVGSRTYRARARRVVRGDRARSVIRDARPVTATSSTLDAHSGAELRRGRSCSLTFEASRHATRTYVRVQGASTSCEP